MNTIRGRLKTRKIPGVCGETESPIACTATKVRQKKVQMTVKTHLYGRDKKEQLKELILDEHEECGCQCSDLAIKRCAGTFNERYSSEMR